MLIIIIILLITTQPQPKPPKFILTFLITYFSAYKGLYGSSWTMEKFEFRCFPNGFQNKQLQEAYSLCIKSWGEKEGALLLKILYRRCGSRSIHGKVFELHFYYVWQRWQHNMRWIKWLMHTVLALTHTAAFLLNLLSESQSYQKYAEWEVRLARAKITHEFQISRITEGNLTTEVERTKKGSMFSS